MKWHKLRFNDKANTHRAGWNWWDLLDEDDTQLACVRYRPDYGYNIEIYELTSGEQWAYFRHALFPTLEDAQGHVIAYFVNKRLEEANES